MGGHCATRCHEPGARAAVPWFTSTVHGCTGSYAREGMVERPIPLSALARRLGDATQRQRCRRRGGALGGVLMSARRQLWAMCKLSHG